MEFELIKNIQDVTEDFPMDLDLPSQDNPHPCQVSTKGAHSIPPPRDIPPIQPVPLREGLKKTNWEKVWSFAKPGVVKKPYCFFDKVFLSETI